MLRVRNVARRSSEKRRGRWTRHRFALARQVENGKWKMEDGKGMILTDCNGLKFALSAVLSTVSQVKVEGPAKAEAIRGISRIQPTRFEPFVRFCGKSSQVPFHEQLTRKLALFQSCLIVANRVIFVKSGNVPFQQDVSRREHKEPRDKAFWSFSLRSMRSLWPIHFWLRLAALGILVFAAGCF